MQVFDRLSRVKVTTVVHPSEEFDLDGADSGSGTSVSIPAVSAKHINLEKIVFSSEAAAPVLTLIRQKFGATVVSTFSMNAGNTYNELQMQELSFVGAPLRAEMSTTFTISISAASEEVTALLLRGYYD